MAYNPGISKIRPGCLYSKQHSFPQWCYGSGYVWMRRNPWQSGAFEQVPVAGQHWNLWREKYVVKYPFEFQTCNLARGRSGVHTYTERQPSFSDGLNQACFFSELLTFNMDLCSCARWHLCFVGWNDSSHSRLCIRGSEPPICEQRFWVNGHFPFHFISRLYFSVSFYYDKKGFAMLNKLL